MIKKQMKTFYKLIISLFIFTTLFSCNIEWNGKMEKELGEYLTTSVEFYYESTLIFTKYYMIGKKLTAEDFPKASDSAIASFMPGYSVTGWQMKNFADVPLDSYTTQNHTNYVTSLTVTNNTIQLTCTREPKTNTPYTVEYYLENIDDDDYTFMQSETKYGTTDTTISTLGTDFTEIPHFTFDSASAEPNIINGDGSSVVKVYYKRNLYKLTFNSGAGTHSELEGKYQEAVDSSTLTVPAQTGFRFYGWWTGTEDKEANSYDEGISYCENLPATFEQDITYYPVWGPVVYKVTFKDQFGKPLTGIISPTQVTPGSNPGEYIWESPSDITFNAPVLTNSDIEFEGWYKVNASVDDAAVDACSNDTNKLNLSGGTYNIHRSSMTDDIIIYAKWKYNNIYVDPERGNDENNGMSASNALKTISKAKKYTFDNINLCSALTDPDDITQIDLFYGMGFTITRYSESNTITFPYIHIKEGVALDANSKLLSIELDGGAIWEEDTTAGSYLFTDESKGNIKKKNTGKTSTVPLIINEGTLYIGYSVILKNNCNTSTSGFMGGAIYNSGVLNIAGAESFEVNIQDNYSASSGGGIYNVSKENIVIKNTKFTDNAAAQRGGAIYISTETFKTAPVINLENVEILRNRSVSSGGGIYVAGTGSTNRSTITVTKSNIKNNYTANKNGNSGSGGGLYSFWTNVVIKENSTISDNYAGDNGGGITSAQGASCTISGTTIQDNNSGANGGGISCTGGSSGVLTLGDGTEIKGNVAAGNGSGLYLSNKTLVLDGGYFDSNNNVYFTIDSIQIRFTDSAKTNVNYYTNGVIATLLPDNYKTTVQIVKLDTGVTLSSPNSSLFKVTDSTDGKKWKINDSGYLEEVIESSEAGGGITNPFNTSVLFAIDTIATSNNGESAWYIKAIVDGTEEIDANNICNSFEDLTIKLYMNGSYVNIENSPNSASVQKPIFPSGYDKSADSFSLEITGRYKINGRLYTNTIEVTM
ncbi:MAG: hypothetical protein MJ179_09400 [Treponema sp.]|nr:hypothetical protein [Treponema sp.]